MSLPKKGTQNPPIKSFGQEGPAFMPQMRPQAPTIDGGEYKKGNTEYSDPFFSGGDFDNESRQNIVEAGQDAEQSKFAMV